MSDLTRFRDHCRRMAAGGSKPITVDGPGGRPERVKPPTDADERAWWKRLAEEADRYVANQPDQEGA